MDASHFMSDCEEFSSLAVLQEFIQTDYKLDPILAFVSVNKQPVEIIEVKARNIVISKILQRDA